MKIKNTLRATNPKAKIYFLHCPYYSLPGFNSSKNKGKVAGSDEQQKELLDIIERYNLGMDELNGNKKAPNFNTDFAHDAKKGQKLQRVIDFKLLRDGCHPSRKLAELWHLRMIRLSQIA